MIINLTPHAIVIPGCTPPIGGPPASWTIAPSGHIARVTEIATPAPSIEGIPTTTVDYGELVDLPDPTPGTWYVVSGVTAAAAARSARGAADLLVPGQQIRDAGGRVIGCSSLARAATPASADTFDGRPIAGITAGELRAEARGRLDAAEATFRSALEVAAQVGALDVTDPAPGWEDRAVDRAKREGVLR